MIRIFEQHFLLICHSVSMRGNVGLLNVETVTLAYTSNSASPPDECVCVCVCKYVWINVVFHVYRP